jgi:hypothetical protein
MVVKLKHAAIADATVVRSLREHSKHGIASASDRLTSGRATRHFLHMLIRAGVMLSSSDHDTPRLCVSARLRDQRHPLPGASGGSPTNPGGIEHA